MTARETERPEGEKEMERFSRGERETKRWFVSGSLVSALRMFC